MQGCQQDFLYFPFSKQYVNSEYSSYVIPKLAFFFFVQSLRVCLPSQGTGECFLCSIATGRTQKNRSKAFLAQISPQSADCDPQGNRDPPSCMMCLSALRLFPHGNTERFAPLSIHGIKAAERLALLSKMIHPVFQEKRKVS